MEKKKYSVIYADPPWQFKAYSAKGMGRSAEKHYPTMDIEAIKGLPVGELFARTRPEGWDVWGNEVNSDIVMEGSGDKQYA